MKSLKRIIAFIMSMVFTILFIFSFLNLFYLRDVFSELESLNHQLMKYNNNYLEMDLPIRVLNNVVTQLNPDDNLDSVRRSNLLDAYHRNHQLLQQKSEALYNHSREITKFVEALDRRRLLAFSTDFSGIKEIGHQLNYDTNNLRLLVDNVSLQGENPPVSTAVMENMATAHQSIKPTMDHSLLEYSSLRGQISFHFIFINFLAFLAILIIILILSALLMKLLMMDFPFIVKGFRMLYHHDYDLNLLPKTFDMFVEEKEVKSIVTNVLQEQKMIDDIKNLSSNEYILTDVLEKVFSSVQEVLATDRIGIAFIDYNTETIIAEHGVFKYREVLLGPGFVVNFKDTTLVELLKTKESKIIYSIDEELKKRPESESLNLLKKEGVKSNMIVPLINNETVIGFLFFSSIKENNYDEHTLHFANNIGYELSSIINKTYLTEKMFANVTGTFADIVEQKDLETGDHIKRMTSYSQIIAEGLLNHPEEGYRVTQGFIRDLENNAAVHDIGKVGIPDKILRKPDRLDLEEWKIMQQHATMGADVLVRLKDSLKIFNKDFYEMAIDIARHHHERWDGSGYPDGLSGDAIPLAARIVAIADVFDAISSKRVYKNASSFEETVAIINQGSGTHFDPELVKVFNASLDKFKKIYDGDYTTV